MMNGLISGINARRGAVIAAAQSVAAAAASAVNGALKIHSPSRVMMETGRYVDEGLIKGIEYRKDAVSAAATANLANPVKETSNDLKLSLIHIFIKKDVQKIFMNPDEFSEIHNINGKDMPIQIDANEQIEREKRQNQNSSGIYVNQKLVYVSAQDYGKLPKQGSRIVMDGYLYMVADAIDEGGVYTLTLEVVRA